MSARNILTLSKPMAPCLIQILYWIALVFILLGVLHGVARGVWTMNRQMPPHSPAISQSSSTPNAMSPGAPPVGWHAGWQHHHGQGFGNPGFQGPGISGYRPRGFMMMRHMPPPVRGSLRILLAFLRGLVMVMVVRVLAEIGTAILAMKAKET
jgi:hypothetical protein